MLQRNHIAGLLLLFATNLKADLPSESTYFCNINHLTTAQAVTPTTIPQWVDRFTISLADNKGIKRTFGQTTALFFRKNDRIIVKLEDQKGKIELSASYPLSDEQFFLSGGPLGNPNIKTECIQPSYWEKLAKDQQLFFLPSLGPTTNLLTFRAPLKLSILTDLVFTYDELESMQNLYFQKGQLFRDSELKNQSHPWCIFQIKATQNHNVIVPQATNLAISSIDLVNNQTANVVLTYSFIDYTTGRAKINEGDYQPFTFKCSLPNTLQSFTLEQLKEVTGGRIQLK